MKTRTGFVSNSSSTSFIIGLGHPAEPCPHCGRGGDDLVRILESHNHYETELEWSDPSERLEELDREIREYTDKGWEDDTEYLEDEKKLIVEARKKFPQVIGVSVSYHDEFLSHMLEEMGKAGDITILRGG